MPLIVAVAVLMRAAELLGVVAVAVGLLLPELVEPPHALTSSKSTRPRAIRKGRFVNTIMCVLLRMNSPCGRTRDGSKSEQSAGSNYVVYLLAGLPSAITSEGYTRRSSN